jgi:hypothetical protein
MGDAGVLGPTPMQSFKGSNFAGVPQPKLMNDSKSFDYTTESSGTATEQKHILFIAALFIVVAYAVWHFMYER